MKRWEIYLELLIEFGMALAVILMLGILLPKTLAFLWPFVAAGIISFIANPLCKFLEKKIKIKKKFGSAIIIILVLGAIVGTFYLIFSKLGEQAVEFGTSLPELVDNVTVVITDFFNNIKIEMIKLPDGIVTIINDVIASLDEYIKNIVNAIGKNSVQYASRVASNLTNGLIGLIVTILASYFFLADQESIFEKAKKMMPPAWVEKAVLIKNKLLEAIGSYVFAQIKIMAVVFAILLVGFLIGGIKYSLLFAFLICILDVLPFFGTGTALVPWAIYDVITKDYKEAILLVVLYVVCLLARQIIQPKIIGDSVGLSPLMTLFLIYVGLKIGGFTGFILAMIVGVAVVNLYHVGLFDDKINRIRTLFRMLKERDLNYENHTSAGE